jgi:hypothetical protein
LIPRQACLGVIFGFKKKIGSLSEDSVPVLFISMVRTTTEMSAKLPSLKFSKQSGNGSLSLAVNLPLES